MYLLILYKDINVLGTMITKREVLTLESLDALKPEVSWYKNNGYKLEAMYKGEWEMPYAAEQRILNFFHDEKNEN